MPEIAAIGLVGAVITFIVVNLNLFWVHRSFNQNKFKTLNHNFSKVGRYWSLEQGRIFEMNPGDDQKTYIRQDHQKSTRAAFLFGTMMIFLSWFGLLIFMIYFVSTNKLAKSRLEVRIFESELVKNRDLDENEVRTILKDLESLS